jgi:predicted acyltransferase
MNQTTTTPARLLALDALRGFTIIAMIIVNDPGSWSHVYPPLLHAQWNGLTPTDYIFPFFLFIVGVSIALAYGQRLESGVARQELLKKIGSRTLKIYFLGIFLWLFPEFDFSAIRWVGVLHRIALVFLACSLIYLYVRPARLPWIAAFSLLGYWLVMAYAPVPGIGAPDLSVPEKNWAHYLDSILLPGVLWQKTWDPEGLLSTIPSICTGIFGMMAGRILLLQTEIHQKLVRLFVMGFALLAIGDLWQWFFPFNKNIWSSSFAALLAGMTALALATMVYLVDVRGWKKWIFPGQVFGSNAITAYVLAGILTAVFYNDQLIDQGLNGRFMALGTGLGLAPELCSLLYAVFYVAVIFVPVYVLFRKKIFVKL